MPEQEPQKHTLKASWEHDLDRMTERYAYAPKVRERATLILKRFALAMRDSARNSAPMKHEIALCVAIAAEEELSPAALFAANLAQHVHALSARINALELEQEDRDARVAKKMARLGPGTSQGVRIGPLPGLKDTEGLSPGRVSADPQPRGERITYQGRTFEVTGIDGDSLHGITAFRVREPGPRKDGGGEGDPFRTGLATGPATGPPVRPGEPVDPEFEYPRTGGEENTGPGKAIPSDDPASWRSRGSGSSYLRSGGSLAWRRSLRDRVMDDFTERISLESQTPRMLADTLYKILTQHLGLIGVS